MRKLWRALVGQSKRDQELSQELISHLEMEIEMRLKRGETPADAERAARLALGNLTSVAEQTRESWSFSFLTSFVQDLSFAWRLMKKSPVFTLAAVASLGLGISANTAIYSVFSKVLKDPLAVAAPEDLYQLSFRTLEDKPDESSSTFSYPFAMRIEKQATTVEATSCFTGSQPSFRSGNSSRILQGELVCGNFFDMLGVKPALGRMLTASDNLRPGEHPVVVLANHFWRSEFGGDPGVLGQVIELNRRKFTVVGVTPPGFLSMRKGSAPFIFMPIVMDGFLSGESSATISRNDWWPNIVLRKKQGVSVERMNAELTALRKQDWDAHERPSANEYSRKLADSATVFGQPAARGFDSAEKDREYDRPFQMLMGVVGLVLLIACINIANLLLARASARQRELSTRLALGASRWRLVRQFLTESLALSALGGLAGLLLALTLERVLIVEAFGKNSLLLVGDGLPWQVLATTLALSLLTGIGFGIIPALTADRQGIQTSQQFIGRKLMVSFQVALSVLLLSGAGLFLQTLENLRRIDSGFSRENLLTMNITPDPEGRSKEALLGYYRNVAERVRQVAGVKDLSLSNVGILSGAGWTSGIQVAGVVVPPGEPVVLRNAVGPRFFSVMGAKLIEGRDFAESDNKADGPKVAIVNESFARRFYGTGSALGRKIGRGRREGFNDQPDHTIIGVVKDLRDYKISGTGDRFWYVPYEQQDRLQSMNLNVRTNADALALLKVVKAAVSEIDAYVPISRETTMVLEVEGQIGQERLVARLSAFFAGVALLLAVVGLYGVMSYSVERRTKEIGIRMALGESRGQVLWIFLRESILYVGVGILAGLPLALGLGAYAEKLLYGVKPVDWLSIGFAVLVIGFFGLLAGLISARGAASIEPLAALRNE